MEPLNIYEIGDQGEREVYRLLREAGITRIRRPDFCIFPKNLWLTIEVKNKEPFEPPPAYMQGMPKIQYINDMSMTNLGMPSILVVKGKTHDWHDWLAQYIIKLEPQPDPRTHIKSHDEIVWFNLTQFEPIAQFLSKIQRGI